MRTKVELFMTVENILIVELWGIGDLMMMSAILEPLRKAFPRARITILSKAISHELFKYEPAVDEIVAFDFPWTAFRKKYFFWRWDWKGLVRVIKKLRKKRFDLIFDARADLRNQILSFLIKGKKCLGFPWKGFSLFLTDSLKCDYTCKHRVEAWLSLLNYLGIATAEVEPRLLLSEDERIWARSFLQQNGIMPADLVIGVHPGARIKTRCWPLERFTRVCEYIQEKYCAKIIIFVDPQGYGDSMVVRGEFLKVKLSLRQLAALISQLDVFICNDSGPMHIAAALHVPTVAVFGPTEPKWFSPWGKKHTVIVKDGIPCRPCFDYCKQREPFCLTGISLNEVLRQVDIQLASNQKECRHDSLS